MEPSISVVIPAYNEADRIAETLRAVSGLTEISELVVIDDGSSDDTAVVSRKWADRVIRQPYNRGKGYALEIGWKQTTGDIVVFLDADLGQTAEFASKLVEPVIMDECDMTIAKFPPAKTKGGFGIVKGLADQGVRRLTGHRITSPLSGQRAVKRTLLASLPQLAYDFGIEISLTVEALRHGFRICEVPIAFDHRESGRNWKGFVHRGRQFVDISKTLYRLWRAI